MFNFYIKQPKHFPKWWCQFALPPAVFKNFSCATYSLTFGIVRWVYFFCSNCLNTVWNTLHCGFNLHLSADYWYWAYFHELLGICISFLGFPDVASSKEPACQSRRQKRHGFDPWLGKISWGEHGNPLQYSCLENTMDREALWATVLGVAKSQKWLKHILFRWSVCSYVLLSLLKSGCLYFIVIWSSFKGRFW